MGSRKTSRKNGQAERLAEVLSDLPAAMQYQLLDVTTDFLVAEGKEEQLDLLCPADEGAPPTRSKGRGAKPYPKPRSRKKKIAFGWYGGKYSHLNWLLPVLPEAHHYCEPFGGSAAVLLNPDPSPVETYNDLDGDVARFFRVLRDSTEELLKAIAFTPFSREEFANALEAPPADASDVELARRFFVRARQVRTGLAQTASIGRWANCKKTSRAGMSGVVSRWLGSVKGLPEVALRLLRVQIENRPALDVIELYDSPDTLFYCDPPYPHETRGDTNAYKYEMTSEEHEELADLLGNVEGKVAVSGYRCDLMDRLYKNWERIEAEKEMPLDQEVAPRSALG
jgi:DNA adenine methylase